MKKLTVFLTVSAVCLAAATASGAGSAGRYTLTAGSWYSDWFVSPTGNIRCRYFPYQQVLACKTLNNGRVAVAPLYGSAYAGYIGDYSFPSGPVLYYGQTYTVSGKFRCVSRVNGMFCRSLQTGRGFGIAREGYRLY
ncbi:MAG: hypothetical protein ABR521_06510 [Gaiellaceae bacterium]